MCRAPPGYGDNAYTHALSAAEKGRLSTRSNSTVRIRESADPIEVLYGSCNGESSGVSLLSVACVSHELHARKILDERPGPNRRPHSSLPRTPARLLGFPRTILR